MSTASKLKAVEEQFKARLGQQAPQLGVQGQAYDPKNPSITVQSQSVIPLRDLFKGAPTQAIYDVIELLNEILGTRQDAKR